MPKVKRPNLEYTAGCREERRAVRAYIKRMKALEDWHERFGPKSLLDWLNARDKRTAKRKGGAGRK